LRHPTAINRVNGACDRLSCVTAQEDGERTNALRLGELMHRLLLRLVPNQRHRLLTLTVVSGAVCGLAAVVFPIVVAVALGVMTPWLKRRMHGRDV
jgi:hypothetical protein